MPSAGNVYQMPQRQNQMGPLMQAVMMAMMMRGAGKPPTSNEQITKNFMPGQPLTPQNMTSPIGRGWPEGAPSPMSFIGQGGAPQNGGGNIGMSPYLQPGQLPPGVSGDAFLQAAIRKALGI